MKTWSTGYYALKSLSSKTAINNVNIHKKYEKLVPESGVVSWTFMVWRMKKNCIYAQVNISASKRTILKDKIELDENIASDYLLFLCSSLFSVSGCRNDKNKSDKNQKQRLASFLKTQSVNAQNCNLVLVLGCF